MCVEKFIFKSKEIILASHIYKLFFFSNNRDTLGSGDYMLREEKSGEIDETLSSNQFEVQTAADLKASEQSCVWLLFVSVVLPISGFRRRFSGHHIPEWAGNPAGSNCTHHLLYFTCLRP